LINTTQSVQSLAAVLFAKFLFQRTDVFVARLLHNQLEQLSIHTNRRQNKNTRRRLSSAKSVLHAYVMGTLNVSDAAAHQ
jgi:hypothetical protein